MENQQRPNPNDDRGFIKSLLAPDVETQNKRTETLKSISAYLIISIILILVMFIAPFFAGGITGEGWDYYLPSTTAGWVEFWAIRAGTMVGNMAVFILFKQQAKINSRNHPNYLKAEEIINSQFTTREFIPRSPKQMNAKEYTTKGIFMVIFTLGESIVIGSMVLNFDIVTFISCLTSSVTAVLFGWWTMIKNEIYWTDEYLKYAEYVQRKNELAAQEEQTND